MTRKLIVTVVALTSVIMACSANPRKLAVNRKGGSGGGQGGGEVIELAKVKEIAESNQPCLQLQTLLNAFTTETGRQYTIHMRDSDFMEKQGLPWKEIGKDGKTEEIATRARILITEEKPPLFEMIKAENLASSRMLGPYLAVKLQTECKTITFADGKTFTIQPNPAAPTQQQMQQQQPNRKPGVTQAPINNGNPKLTRRHLPPSLTLVGENTPEARKYSLIGNRLVIEIFQPAGAVENCKKESVSSLVHRSEYVLSFGTRKIFTITQRLAELLKATLPNPGNLDRKPEERRREFARERGRMGGGAGGIPVEAEELIDYTGQISSGQLKPVACK